MRAASSSGGPRCERVEQQREVAPPGAVVHVEHRRARGEHGEQVRHVGSGQVRAQVPGRLAAFDDAGVTFKWKDYRDKQQPYGKVMTLTVDEFIRHFLIHVLPSGFHRIRHYGMFANGGRAENIARARQLLQVPEPPPQSADTADGDGGETVQVAAYPCPCCGGRMIVIETLERRYQSRAPPFSATSSGKAAS